MKATDLMPGDLVTFKDCQNDANPVVIKIWQINADGGAFVSIDRHDALDEITIDDEIVGIPLTPEILEKNGFKKLDNYKWEYGDNSCKIEMNIAPQIEIEGEILGTPPINMVFEGALFDINITSDMCVHELQHCLKLVGIDKEIVL